MGDAYFGLYLFAMGRGRPRTFDELAALLQAAGFVHVQRKKTRIPLLTSLIVARAGALEQAR
jgi:demethylspheroidene O-methyltransferase